MKHDEEAQNENSTVILYDRYKQVIYILMPRENVGNARTLTLSIAFRQAHWPIPLAKSCPNKRKTTVLAGNKTNKLNK